MKPVYGRFSDGYYQLYYCSDNSPVPIEDYDKYDVTISGVRMNVGDYIKAIDNSYKNHSSRKVRIRKTNKKASKKLMAVLFVLNLGLTAIVVKDHFMDKAVNGDTQIETSIDNNEVSFDNLETTTVDISDEELTNTKDAYVNNYAAYDCNCPIEMQEKIYKICQNRGIDFNVMMCILDRESGGNFNTSGVINATKDYGYAQINECNHQHIYENLGYTTEDILNNDEKNVDAAAYLLQNIYRICADDIKNGDYSSVFGMYNGWTRWQEYSSSRDYSAYCVDKLNNTYNKTSEELNYVFGNIEEEHYGRNL